MPGTRSFFAVGEFDGRIIVAGGHDENKNALSTAWEYDASLDEWTELSRISQERDECQGMVIGSEFWVVSGYRTDNQGAFEGSAELMDLKTGEWSRVEEAWKASQCPRSSVGIGKEKKLLSWADRDSAIRARWKTYQYRLSIRVFRVRTIWLLGGYLNLKCKLFPF